MMDNQQNELNEELQLIQDWLKSVKFKRVTFGGVDEVDVWRKIEELNALYERALVAERARLRTVEGQQDE